MDLKKYECANGLFPNRWKSYRMLEISNSFYKLAKNPKLILTNGKSLWDAFWQFCQDIAKSHFELHS